MRYILDDLGYIEEISFGGTIECNCKTCTEYNGTIPKGYESLCEWAENVNIRAYKIVDGNLVYDENREKKLNIIAEDEAENNRCVTYKEIKGITNETYRDIEPLFVTKETDYEKVNKLIDSSEFPIEKIEIVTEEEINDLIQINLNGINILKNELTSQTINGVKVKVNEDYSIKITGTAKEDINLILCGSDTNTIPLFTLKKDISYYLTSGITTTLYNYDGTARTQIYSDLGGSILFTDADKQVTEVVLNIASGETLNTTIYPMINVGDAEEYEPYKNQIINILLEENIFYPEDKIIIENKEVYLLRGLFPRNDLFPSDDLFPQDIEKINLCYLETPTTYTKKTTIYSYEDVQLKTTYVTGDLNNSKIVEALNLSADIITLKGNRVIIDSDKFKLDEDGRIEATSGEIGGFNMNDKSFSKSLNGIYNYNNFDTILAAMSVMNRIATDNHLTNVLDINDDYDVTSADYMKVKQIINGELENIRVLNGSFNINSSDPKNCISIKDDYDEFVVGLGLGGINSTYVTCNNFVCGYPSENAGDFIGTTINGETGNVTCVSLTQTSKKEFKKNFLKLDNALDIVKGTDIYKYHLINQNDDDKKHIGFIIGDEYNYSKEITSPNNDGADIYSMVSVCFKAIKEQQEQIENLKEEIKELKEMIK